MSEQWMRATTAALVVATLGTTGCGDQGPGEEPAIPAGEPPAQATSRDTAPRGSPRAAPSPTRVALPGLFSIMAALQGDMAKVGRGLWLENMDTVAAGADGIANHPRVPPEEFETISGVLGQEMSRFGGMDMEVHDLAVRLAEEARRGDLEAVLGTDAELRRGCVACHSAFRERLRTEIR